MNFRSPHSVFLALAFFLLPFTFFLLSPPSAFATCYCATPTADQCKCTASPPAGVDLFDGNLGGVAVKCTSQAEANSVFELKNPVCGGATETVPYCAPEILDPSRYRCYGRSFIPSSSVDPQLQTVPDGTWKEPVVGPFYFNSFNSPSGSFKVYICDSGLFCCTDQAGICSETGIPRGGSCTPQTGPGNPAVCENIPPPGTGTPSPTPAPQPTPDYPPPGTLCNQYQFTNEPHPLRPAPALVCEDKVPEPFNLSCANDVVPRLVIGRPRTTTNPGDSLDANTSCSKSGCRWSCSRQETLTEAIIGPVDITIDLTGLELPVAGIASRNCETGYCDVDRLNPATGDPALSDGFLMRNYTSWYLQGAIEQADQEPPYQNQQTWLERILAYAGPLKKLIPKDVLNNERIELIAEAVAGRTYDQIIGYVNGNQVISRMEAKQKGLTGSGHVVRLTDMKDHIAPAWDPHSRDGNKWYYLWQQTPFTSFGHVDTAGEFFPTACLRSHADDRRCESDPKVLDAKLKVTSGLDSFRVYFPHLVEDDTLLMKLLQNALISQEVPRTDAIPTYTELSQNLTNHDRLPEWTVSDDGTYRNAGGCQIKNALYNPGDSLEAKRNKKQGIITGELQFKREVSYSYQVSDSCDVPQIGGDVPVPVSAPVPVHIRYSHMDEIGDRTVVGPGSIFKALYPDIPLTVGKEIPNRPAESSLKYSCTGNGNCQADSNPKAFFPWWGTTLEFFHQKIQCMLDPLQQGCSAPPVPPFPNPTPGPSPTPGPATVCATYQPYSAGLSSVIDQTIARGQAAAKVPKGVLEAIYAIEGFTAFTNPGAYTCSKNPASALGLMQITDDAYNWTVPPAQKPPNDEHLCSATPDILSRCNPVDAMEIAARVLLVKVGKWDFSNFQPTGNITAKQDVYDASCRYYGRYSPDQHTNDRGNDDWSPASPPVPDTPDGQTSYCEVVCARSGFCPPYPWPRP